MGVYTHVTRGNTWQHCGVVAALWGGGNIRALLASPSSSVSIVSVERKIFGQNIGSMPSPSQAGTNQTGEPRETRGLFHPACPQRCLLAQRSSV